jgi:hypothetical protein
MTDLSIQSTPAPATADFTWLAGDSAAFGNAQSGTIQVSSLTSGTHYDATTKVVPSGLAVAKVGNYLVPFGGVSEVQTVTVTGSPTGGSFTLTVNGQTTAAIAYNATAAQVKAALEALSSVSVVSVTGSGPYVVTFGGGANVPQLTATASLTGGSTPGVTVATTTAGGDTDGSDVLAGFIAYPIDLKQDSGALATVEIAAYIVDAVIIPANLPVAAHRSIDRSTPTTGKFAFQA